MDVVRSEFGPHIEPLEDARERLLNGAAERFASGEIDVEELERRLERYLTDDALVERERHYWESR